MCTLDLFFSNFLYFFLFLWPAVTFNFFFSGFGKNKVALCTKVIDAWACDLDKRGEHEWLFSPFLFYDFYPTKTKELSIWVIQDTQANFLKNDFIQKIKSQQTN